MLDRWFALTARGSTVAAETRGGLTTFMVMADIIFIKLVRGKGGAVHPMMWGAVLAFAIYFAMPALRRVF